MEGDERRSWTLLTSHGHVLVEIARNPQARVRDISAVIGITERATQSIIADLERAGYVERVRVGRRTNYVLHADNPFRHAAQEGLVVGPFLQLLTGAADPRTNSRAPSPEPELEDLVAAAMETEAGSADSISEPETMEGLVVAAMEADAGLVDSADSAATPVAPAPPVAPVAPVTSVTPVAPLPATEASGSPAPPDGIPPAPGGPELPAPGLS